jgi:hypothetical protein
MLTLDWLTVWRQRLARHFLDVPAPATQLTNVVGAVGGIHAQVIASAELSLGLRVAGATQATVRAALWEQRSLVRTYGLRGTIHIFSADELPLWLAALRAKSPPRGQNANERNALPAERVRDVLAAMADALDGHCLTRTELAAALQRRLGDWVAHEVFPAFGGYLPRWQLALSTAAYQGVLAFGPNRGNQVTYERLGPLPDVDGQAALQEVFRRYLRAYGPATHVEFARWFLMDARAARSLRESLTDELEPVDVDGWRAWQLREEAPVSVESTGSVNLLPYFDCYLVGAHPRAQLMPESVPERIRKIGTVAPFAVLLIDGVVGGWWRRQRRGQRLEIQVGAFQPLSSTQQDQVANRAARIGEILECSVNLTFGPVDPQSHL